MGICLLCGCYVGTIVLIQLSETIICAGNTRIANMHPSLDEFMYHSSQESICGIIKLISMKLNTVSVKNMTQLLYNLCSKYSS